MTGTRLFLGYTFACLVPRPVRIHFDGKWLFSNSFFFVSSDDQSIYQSGGAAHDVPAGDSCRGPAGAVGGAAQLPRPRTGARVLAAAHAREARPRQGFVRSDQDGINVAVDLAGAVP